MFVTACASAARADERAAEATAPRPPTGATIETSAELSTYADTMDVTVVSPTARLGTRDEDAGYGVGLRYLVDVVSAASADIVSTASARWQEVRHAVSVDADYTRDDLRGALSGGVSIEPDYQSLNIGATPSVNLDRDHITLTAGYAFGHDTIGRAHTSFDDFHRTLVRHQMGVGASFVLGPSSLLWIGADAIIERGDQSKPYRYVPMFDASVAPSVPRGASIDLVHALRRDERPLEQLPTARDRYAGTLRFLHRSSWSTLRLEERVYADSWSQVASTTSARYAMDLSSRTTLAPDVRVHLQSGASFWARAQSVVEDGGVLVLPRFRTGDRELGPLTTITVGAELRLQLTPPATANRVAIVLRLAGIRTDFFDALFVTDRNAVFSAVGFDGAFR